MGNCVEVVRKRRGEEEEEEAAAAAAAAEEEKEKKGGMRIKVVLTKEELEWLMEQIKEMGGRSLEQLLDQIETQRGIRSRKALSGEAEHFNTSASWKPSLDSIMECPELPDQMHR